VKGGGNGDGKQQAGAALSPGAIAGTTIGVLVGVALAGVGWPDASTLEPLALDTVAAAALHPGDGTADDDTADAFLRASLGMQP
jgi:hypothetical protein